MSRVPAILLVCTGNICRSPTAEAVLRQMAGQAGLDLRVDSAGTSDEERGNPPSRHSAKAAARRGWRMPDRRARQVRPDDFLRFDHLVAMTRSHLSALRRAAPAGATCRIGLLMDHAPEAGVTDVPDPWYGGPADYELALDLIEAGCRGLLRDLRGPAA